MFEDMQVTFFIWNNKAVVKAEDGDSTITLHTDLEIYSTRITMWRHPILDEYVSHMANFQVLYFVVAKLDQD